MDADDVEGIGFAAMPRGSCRAGGNDQSAVAGYLITHRRVPGVAHVQMSGEQKIRSAFRQRRHRQVGPAQQIVFVVVRGQIKRMMRDYDLRKVVVDGA